VFAATTFLELPYDLGLDLVHVWTYESGDPWPGWDRDSMAAVIGVPAALEEGTRPLYRLVFRRTPLRVRSSDDAVESAFLGWLRPELSACQRFMRRIRLRLDGMRGQAEYHTVVGVTRYRAVAAFPDPDREATGDWVEESLAALNDFLVALGLQNMDPLIGPVALSELPPVAPMLMEIADIPVGFRVVVPVHPWEQSMLGVPRAREELERAAFIFDAWYHHRDPTFPPLELLHTARRDLLAGRHAVAAVIAGTAIEMLVDITLRQVWGLAGLPAASLNGVLQSPFRSQVEVHLGRVLGVTIDLTDQNSEPGRWWHTGYDLRNRVVHSAYRPDMGETLDALRSAFELTAFVGRELERRPQTAPARGLLPTHRIPAHRYAFLVDSQDAQ
jgi:hypothetical protein